MWLFIEALDVLLFRDSKPFAAGESVWARSVFPPNSLPFIGALRAKFLVDNKIAFADYHKFLKGEPLSLNLKEKIKNIVELIGNSTTYGNLNFVGMFLSQQTPTDQFDAFFPAPLDLIINKKTKKPKYLQPRSFDWTLKTSKTLTSKTNYNFSPLPLWTNESGDLPEGKLVRAEGLLNYLRNYPRLQIKESEELWGSEFQVGIEKNPQRTAETGKLYSIEFVRLMKEEITENGFFANGFFIYLDDLDGIELAEEGFLALGGEGRAAKYITIKESEISDLTKLKSGDFLLKSLQNENQFKIYLATPAIFSNGWYPDFLQVEGDSLVGEIDRLKFKLISASVSKPIPVSGWDVVNKRPRPLVKAVPAGSVYHFELADKVFDEDKIAKIQTTFHFKKLTGNCVMNPTNISQNELEEYGKAGFGLALVGKI